MRRDERVTVQGPVKKQQPDGMSHGGGGGGTVAPGVGYGARPRPLDLFRAPQTLFHSIACIAVPQVLSRNDFNLTLWIPLALICALGMELAGLDGRRMGWEFFTAGHELTISKASQEHADSLLNHVLKNIMVDVSGCIELHNSGAGSPELLNEAQALLFRGMWWCRMREAILSILAGRCLTPVSQSPPCGTDPSSASVTPVPTPPHPPSAIGTPVVWPSGISGGCAFGGTGSNPTTTSR